MIIYNIAQLFYENISSLVFFRTGLHMIHSKSLITPLNRRGINIEYDLVRSIYERSDSSYPLSI
jgi:hypothetical protein